MTHPREFLISTHVSNAKLEITINGFIPFYKNRDEFFQKLLKVIRPRKSKLQKSCLDCSKKTELPVCTYTLRVQLIPSCVFFLCKYKCSCNKNGNFRWLIMIMVISCLGFFQKVQRLPEQLDSHKN